MLEHVRQRQEEIRKSITSSIGGQALTDDQLEKSADEYFEKAGRKAAVGEIRSFGGREYIKTSSGWKFHGKGGGSKASEHREGALKHHVEAEQKRNADKEAEDKKKTELGEHAKRAAETNLKKVVKEHPDPGMRSAANAELARRKKEEAPKEKDYDSSYYSSKKEQDFHEGYNHRNRQLKGEKGKNKNGNEHFEAGKRYAEEHHKNDRSDVPATAFEEYEESSELLNTSEGSLVNEEGEIGSFRVYKDGGVKVEGNNFRKDFTNKEEAIKYLSKHGFKKKS